MVSFDALVLASSFVVKGLLYFSSGLVEQLASISPYIAGKIGD